jgi:peptidoglycan/LPS O-acetylase OafA/YrhL
LGIAVKSNKYEPSLDGIRAVAITAVVLYHSAPNWFPGGWAGVDAFFVLSGYLITRLLSDEIKENGSIDFQNFYIRRALRLAPAFVVLLVVELAFDLIESSPQKWVNAQAVHISGLYLMNWNRAFDWLPEGHLGHTWSLAMEEQFYLLWPMMLLMIWRRDALRWTVTGIFVVFAWRTALAISGAGVDRTYNGFDTHADALLMGCALSLCTVSDSVRDFARRYAIIYFALSASAADLHPNHRS